MNLSTSESNCNKIGGSLADFADANEMDVLPKSVLQFSQKEADLIKLTISSVELRSCRVSI